MTNPKPETPETPNAAVPERSTSLTLLQRLRTHDEDAWSVMVRLYTPLVCHWCVRGGVKSADVEDVVQEVFHAASTHLQQFRRDRPGDSFRGWLRGIAHNLVLQHFRRNSRHPKASGGTDALLQLNSLADTSPGEAEGEDPAEELDGVRRRALELVRTEFEERTWQAFWQTVIDGRSPVDIAADMGVSPAAVRMAKSRVLRRLKEEFGELIR